MSLSTYDASVPVLLRGLSTLDVYLDAAEKLATEQLPIAAILETRLAPDMLNLAEQIDIAARKAMRHAAALARHDASPPAPASPTLAGLRKRLNEAASFIDGLPKDVIADAETHTFELSIPIVRGWIGGSDYILELIVPDFLFHVAMGHAILRHLGAPLGKRDFLGALSVQSGGYT